MKNTVKKFCISILILSVGFNAVSVGKIGDYDLLEMAR